MKFASFIFASVMLLICATPAFAALTEAEAKRAESQLNSSSPNAMQVNRLGSLVMQQKKHVARANWKFSRDGGAMTTPINLKTVDGNPLKLPKGAIVSDCLLDFKTAAQGATATLSFSTGQSAADLKSALAVASATGLVTCIPVGTAATSIKLTADRQPTLVIATAALTAGEVNVLIEYWLSDI